MIGIQLNPTTGDLLIAGGTLSIGNTSEQNAQLIIASEKGEWKEFPTLGVGLHKYINATGREREMVREIKLQLGLDNITASYIGVNDGKLVIEL